MDNNAELKDRILAAVEDYVATPEAWEEAQLIINPATGEVDLIEIEEADDLADDIDVYAVMDLVEMTPDGAWIPDPEAIASVAADY